MKHKLLFTMLITACIITGCHHPSSPFTTFSLSGSHSYMVKTDDPYLPETLNPFGVENSYSLVWPTKGMMSKDAEKELIMLVFNDSTANSVNEAAQRWLNNLWLYEETKALETKTVDSVTGKESYTYAHLSNDIKQHDNLVTFITSTESFLAGAAHFLALEACRIHPVCEKTFRERELFGIKASESIVES